MIEKSERTEVCSCHEYSGQCHQSLCRVHPDGGLSRTRFRCRRMPGKPSILPTVICIRHPTNPNLSRAGNSSSTADGAPG